MAAEADHSADRAGRFRGRFDLDLALPEAQDPGAEDAIVREIENDGGSTGLQDGRVDHGS